MYVIAERNAANFPLTADEWSETKAHSIEGAKRAAVRNQMFQDTSVYVGWKHEDGSISHIAHKHPKHEIFGGTWLNV